MQNMGSTRSPAPGELRLTVVVPAYREAPTVAQTVARIRDELAAVADHGGLEVVVVDDGSGDGTADAARAGGADQVIALPVNRGKGAAVRAGVAVARGRTIAFTDADLAYAPAQIARFLEEAEAGADMVVGSRFHADTTTLVKAPWLREVGGRAINLATKLVLHGPHRDTQCGLKAFRSDVAKALFGKARIDGFAFDVELFHLAERYHLTLVEVPVEVANTVTSTVRVARDAARLLVDLVRIRRFAAAGAYDLGPGGIDALLSGPTEPSSPGPADPSSGAVDPAR
jgi:glycosyltransferase involved in cell wall biosynthesis